MRWEILCLTMPTRTEFLYSLKAILEPQIHAHKGEVQFVVKLSDPEISLGANRQKMREESSAEYINFFDDDDCPALDYVDRILPLLDGVDYIGFRVQAYEDGKALPGPTYHSLLCGGWFDKTYADGSKSWHRDISHINPIRRELALKVPIYGGFGEDSRWSGDLRKLGIVKTEHFIEQTMYFYLSRTDKIDGVKLGPLTAGNCFHCNNPATVLVGNGIRYCNSCGAEEKL
jgi:hypothetical protein